MSRAAVRKARRKDIVKDIHSIKNLFAPIVHLLRMKREDMVRGVKAAGTFQKWLEEGGKNSLKDDETSAVKQMRRWMQS